MNELNEDQKKSAELGHQFAFCGAIQNCYLNHLGMFPPATHNPERALVVRNQNLAIIPYSPFKPFGK